MARSPHAGKSWRTVRALALTCVNAEDATRRSGMTAQRTVIAQFCDDVRQEIGNKFSLMGCYGSDLYVPAFPITLPKLCARRASNHSSA
jgi:hypothetical protein